ncbi:hypothetical protein SCLCIDRAFT_1152533 [Scleroderma citrinum Foug A]|uniref:Uncharacterized protein n=1 Tax=Scleroderma citrinum Foug A TaxID=1036808 RepID=A0A0C2ZPP7_9AGAM|nr:hypothetical protein SCLCIDRAFT_1152533 [Scleroderma citrinum Foug A]
MRLLNLFHHDYSIHTRALCGRDALISVFENSQQCKQLLFLFTTSPITLRDNIHDTVSTYFKYATLSHRWGNAEPLLHHIQGNLIYDMDPTDGLLKLRLLCHCFRPRIHVGVERYILYRQSQHRGARKSHRIRVFVVSAVGPHYCVPFGRF